jgi:DNA-binding response OmpR family regulator
MEMDKTILIIDDDVDFQFMVGNMLRTSGYSVKSLLEGKVNSALSTARGCDMVLLDIELPGVSGVDVGKELKASPDTLNIPIILVSGHSECDKMFVESGANLLIKKPFSLSGLLTKIKELLTVSDNK